MKSVLFLLLCTSCVWTLSIQKEAIHEVRRNLGGRIIGGDTAEETEFPFMAAIWTTTTLGRYFCGGAIIDRQWILTSASCVFDAITFSIRLGSVSLSSTDINRINVTATISVPHPDYNPETLVNNVGLINLPEPLRYNDFVNVIALPTLALTEGILLTSLGWGQIDDAHSGPVDALYRVSVVSILNEHCKNIYQDQIVDSMVCAIGNYNEGTCIGDIGGPLVQYDGDQPVHVGTASFLSGNGCESLNPSGFERTFAQLEWIKSTANIA